MRIVRRRKDFEECLMDAITVLCVLFGLSVFVMAVIAVPIVFAFVGSIALFVFAMAGICYWWNNRGQHDSTDL